MSDHVLDYIEARVHRRRDRWTTKEVGILPEPAELSEPTIVSRYARCAIETRRRYIDTGVLVSVNGCFDTPSAVARDYLMTKYRYGPKWTSSQRDTVKSEISSHPLFVKPTTFSEGAYIDIRAAYWSVMARVGWDVNYNPGKWLVKQDPPLDFPWQYDKRARNSLVSVARATQIAMWRPESGYRMETRPNPRPNSQLYCLIMDCLNGIASEVINEGAVYVFCDGYIVPDMACMDRVIKRINEWGFEVHIDGVGRGWVTNLGSYAVGRHRSRYQDVATQHSAIKRLPYHSWLKDKMAQATADSPWHTHTVTQEGYRDRFTNAQATLAEQCPDAPVTGITFYGAERKTSHS